MFWDSIEFMPEDIDRIEVIRGPGSSIWGSNAVNGIVNVITKSAAETQGSMVSALYGSTEQDTASSRNCRRNCSCIAGRCSASRKGKSPAPDTGRGVHENGPAGYMIRRAALTEAI